MIKEKTLYLNNHANCYFMVVNGKVYIYNYKKVEVWIFVFSMDREASGFMYDDHRVKEVESKDVQYIPRHSFIRLLLEK